MSFLPEGTTPGRRGPGLIAMLLALWALLPLDAARAHALVVASLPASNSVVPGDDLAVDLQFNSRLDQKRARLRLIPAEGESRDLELLASDDPAHLRAKAGGLTPGDYRIEWYVLSPDGHVTRGNVPFRVLAP
jgi:methionine-rich copper-binding protein CopC